MKTPCPDIKELINFLGNAILKPVLSKDLWQCYDYKKLPNTSFIRSKLFPRSFSLDEYITREVIIMGLIDVVNGINESSLKREKKLLLMGEIVSQFINTEKYLYCEYQFLKNFLSAYISYVEGDKNELYKPILLRAKNNLKLKYFSRFTVGTIKLLKHQKDSHLISIDYIRELVEEPLINEKTLNIPLSDGKRLRVKKVLEELIFKGVTKNDIDIDNYARELCESIKLHYSKAYSQTKDKEMWHQKCQKAMQDFILSREGWKKASGSQDTFYYREKLPARVNLLYTGSTSMLMVVTAINIAKAELVYEHTLSTEEEIEKLVKVITETVKTQDWMVSFPRKKLGQ